MHKASPDTAHVLILPPLLYGTAFVVGLLLHMVFLLHILPTTLVRGIGVVCVLVSLPLALATLRVLSRAHTPVDPMKPTTALVTEGPFRYSRNPIYVALTLLYVGVALLVKKRISPVNSARRIASIQHRCDVGSKHDHSRGMRL